MANPDPPSNSRRPSTSNHNSVLKPEESVTILFHGGIPALQVSTNASPSCEEVEVMCINHIQNFVCAQGTKAETHGPNKYLPAFGLLALPEEKIWLPLNYVFKKNTAEHKKYIFRVRFRPPTDKFSEGNVMCEYLFLQTLDDFLKGSLGKSTKLSTETAFYVLKIALFFLKTLPLNSTQTVDTTFKSRHFYFWNFTKYLSKDLVKRFIHVPVIDHFWVCRAVSTEVNTCKGNIPPAQLGLLKREFYRLLMKDVPEYCFEIYEAIDVHLNSTNSDLLVTADIGIYKETDKEEALYYGQQLQCSLREIYSIKIGKPINLNAPKWTVQIYLESGIIKVLSFAEEGAAESFVSMIQGYFRLCICYDMHLCEELRTPSSRISSELKSLGPIGNTTAVFYLQESKKTAEPGTGGFFIHESLDQVGTYHVKAWHKTDTDADHNNRPGSRNTTSSGLITCLTDMQFKLEMGETIIVDCCRQLRSYLTSTFGPQVLPSLKAFPVLADINKEYQEEMKIEYYGAHSSSEVAQSTPIGLPVMRADLCIGDDIPDKNPLIKKCEVEVHGEKMMLLELQSDQGIYQAAFLEGLMKLQKLYRIKNASFLKFYSTVLDVKFSVLMEFTPDHDLLTYICKHPQTVKQKVDIMDQIIKILVVMERENLYHGNLRLRKFMVFNNQQPGQQPGLVRIKLGDPGIVSHFDTLTLEDINNIERFPWLSPERRNNLKNITYHSEVYALGTTLYELLCQSDQFHEVLKLGTVENGSSEPADSLSRSIQDQLTQLQQHTAQATITTECSGIRKPAPTVDGKVEQARQWLANPGLDDKGLGESATRLVVSEGQKVANCCTGPQKQELLKLCEESVILTHQLSNLKKKGQGNGPQAKAIARNLDEKLTTLKVKVQDAWVSQVQKYLEKNKHFPRPPLLDDNSREPLSEEDEGNKLLSEAVAVVIMMWDIIQKCWSDDVADRPSPHTLLNDVTDVQEKASTIEADTVIDEMKQVAYDIGMERKDMKTDVNKKLTVREIEAMLKTYLNKYYLDPSCLDMEGYKTKLGTGRRSQTGIKRNASILELHAAGHYGAVYRGKMRSPEIYLDRRGQKSADDSPVHWTTVAIKRLKNYPGKGCIIDRRIVYKEIKVAVELDHPNVVKLLHLSTDRHIAEYDPMMIIMEYMNLGSLAKYAEKYGELSDAKRVSHMLKILLDVAEGMVYLSGKEIVHRDLAARNVLLCGWEGVRVTAKVSDFGLARMMEGNYRFYKLNTEDKMPFFWMPPECFPYEGTDKFSSKGDVWSFGIVMWEAFSKGARPDMVLPSDITFVQLLERYKSGWRLGGENIASKDAYSVMMGCWEMDPSRRPAFVELVLRLKKLILELHCF